MPKYKVTEEWSGYSSGETEYEIEAESEEEAKELYREIGKKIQRITIRDDTEPSGYITAEEIS